MASNAAIIAQLEKLHAAQNAAREAFRDNAPQIEYEVKRARLVAAATDGTVEAILAAVKRWVKIESLLRAALPALLRDIANTSDSDLCRSRMFFEAEVRNTLGLPLDAALKEPS